MNSELMTVIFAILVVLNCSEQFNLQQSHLYDTLSVLNHLMLALNTP